MSHNTNCTSNSASHISSGPLTGHLLFHKRRLNRNGFETVSQRFERFRLNRRDSERISDIDSDVASDVVLINHMWQCCRRHSNQLVCC